MKLPKSFFERDALDVAPDLVGKIIVRKFNDGSAFRDTITEVEVYRGTEDLACHASKGKTPRTQAMFDSGGIIYVYMVYGMYWLLNIVTGKADEPQAVLIRCTRTLKGPGIIGKTLNLDKSFYGTSISDNAALWFEDSPVVTSYKTFPRVGVAYAKEWALKPWRFVLDD